MPLISRRTMLSGSLALATAATLAACSSGSDAASVYFLNFKPESDAAFKEVAATYKEKTGVEVKVVTAASNLNGPVGLATWEAYASDMTDLELTGHLSDPTMALKGEDGKVYGLPLANEGYGLIYNAAILNAYIATDGAKITSVEEINSFAKLKEVAEDMQAKKGELGIDGAFASTSLSPGEDWRWQTHLANYPLFYEYRDAGVQDSKDVKLTY